MNNSFSISDGFNYISLSDMVMLIKHNPEYNFDCGSAKKEGNTVTGYVGDRGIAVEHDPNTGRTATAYYKNSDGEWKKQATIYSDMGGASDINQVYEGFLNRSEVYDGNFSRVSDPSEIQSLAQTVHNEGITEEDLRTIKSSVFSGALKQKETPKPASNYVFAPSLENEALGVTEGIEKSSFKM